MIKLCDLYFKEQKNTVILYHNKFQNEDFSNRR